MGRMMGRQRRGEVAKPCATSWSGSQGRHILTDGPFYFQVPGDQPQRPASIGWRSRYFRNEYEGIV
jgi:hypothetical protein